MTKVGQKPSVKYDPRVMFNAQYGDIMEWRQFRDLCQGRPRNLATYEYLGNRLHITWRRAYDWFVKAEKESNGTRPQESNN